MHGHLLGKLRVRVLASTAAVPQWFDSRDLIIGCLVLVMSLISFSVNRLYKHLDEQKESQDELAEKHNNLRAELPEKYVSAQRFDSHMNRIEEMFRLILDKLENKADKK